MRTWHGDVDLIRFCSNWQVEMTHYEQVVDLRTWQSPLKTGAAIVSGVSQLAHAEIWWIIEIYYITVCSVLDGRRRGGVVEEDDRPTWPSTRHDNTTPSCTAWQIGILEEKPSQLRREREREISVRHMGRRGGTPGGFQGLPSR